MPDDHHRAGIRTDAQMKNRDCNFGIHTSLTFAARKDLINIGDYLQLLKKVKIWMKYTEQNIIHVASVWPN